MLRILMTTALCSLLLSGTASATCRPKAGERVVARSSRAVALFVPRGKRHTILTGCSARSGRRRKIAAFGNDGGSGNSPGEVRIAGTRVGFTSILYDTKVGQTLPGPLVVDDAIHGGRRAEVDSDAPLAAGPRTAWALDDHGDVAWVAGGTQLHLQRPGGSSQLIDEGFAISGVSVAPRRLSWTRDGQALRRSLHAEADRCGFRGRAGTDTLAFWSWGSGGARFTAVCRRADGATFRMPLEDASIQAMVATAGSFVVQADQTRLVVLDTAAGTSETVATRPLGRPVIDEHGSAAWLAEGDDGAVQLMVRDADGLRAVHDVASERPTPLPAIARSGTRVRVGDFETELRP